MALHIQMSDEAVRKLKRAALINKLVSFGVCSGMLLLFSGILYFTILIIQGEIPAEFIAYTPPTEDGPPTNNPVARELTSKTSTPTPTVTPSVIVASNAVSAVASPVSFDTSGEISFDDLDVSLDLNSDLGDTLGSGGEGLGSGQAGGSALEGTFYDLKLTRSGAPSRIANKYTHDKDRKPLKDPATGEPGYVLLAISNERPLAMNCVPKPHKQQEVGEALSKFFQSGWNPATLSNYYSPKQKLYASSFYLPQASAGYAPFAYNCQDVCQDAAWICIYRGRVRAPKTGKFRFIGTGDDYLGVRFNKQVVLESGYRIPSLYNKDNPQRWWVSGAGVKDRHWKEVRSGNLKGFEGYELINHIKEIPSWNSNLGGLTAGKTFDVKEGQVYPIEVAISEIPGGAFGFVLFIEDVTNGKVPPGGKYDLFRTNFSIPDKKDIFNLLKADKSKKRPNCLWPPNLKDPDGLQAPPYNEDSPIWTAVP